MRKVPAAFLCAVLLVCAVSGASAQVVSCPDAHLSMTVPDSWTVVPLYNSGDPDLCLLLQDENISLSVYVSDAGGLLPDAFEVFTGDETESGTVVFGGVEMTYVAGQTARETTGSTPGWTAATRSSSGSLSPRTRKPPGKP